MQQLVDQLIVIAFLERFLAEQIFRPEFFGQQVFDSLVGIGNRGAVILDCDMRIAFDPMRDLRTFQQEIEHEIRIPILHDAHSPMILISTRLRRLPSNSP